MGRRNSGLCRVHDSDCLQLKRNARHDAAARVWSRNCRKSAVPTTVQKGCAARISTAGGGRLFNGCKDVNMMTMTVNGRENVKFLGVESRITVQYDDNKIDDKDASPTGRKKSANEKASNRL